MQERSTRKDVVAASASAVLLDRAGATLTIVPSLAICNISLGGAMLVGLTASPRPEPGQRMQLSSSLFASSEVLADVVWVKSADDSCVVGVRFGSLDAKDRERIEAHLRDRRNALRQDADFRGSIQAEAGKEWPADVENISITGALITLPDPESPRFTLGERVRFTCQYMFMDTLECTAVVAWQYQQGDLLQLGLCFEDLSPQHQKLIERFVG